MLNIILRFIMSGLLLLGIDYFMESIEIDDFKTALISIFVLSVVNILVKPILYVLTLPINIMTLGLFTLVINGTTFYLTSHFVDGFEILSLVGALVGSLLLTIGQTLISIIKR